MALETQAPERERALLRPRRRGIDWGAVEQDYSTGLLSLRELAEKHDCSHSAIANFAGRHGWTRNRLPHSRTDGEKSRQFGKST
jgi:uncharacterized protein YjcR